LAIELLPLEGPLQSGPSVFPVNASVLATATAINSGTSERASYNKNCDWATDPQLAAPNSCLETPARKSLQCKLALRDNQ
jgi:hypothetical protein